MINLFLYNIGWPEIGVEIFVGYTGISTKLQTASNPYLVDKVLTQNKYSGKNKLL